MNTDTIKTAVLSDCGTYRYRLTRIWDASLYRVLFIMLNPSTADAETDDPTIRRCIGYAKAWGYGGIEVVNLFAYRATNPADLKKAFRPIGPDNRKHQQEAACNPENKIVVCAWGEHGAFLSEAWLTRIAMNKAGIKLYYLELSKGKNPKHPLYLKGDLTPTEWKPIL